MADQDIYAAHHIFFKKILYKESIVIPRLVHVGTDHILFSYITKSVLLPTYKKKLKHFHIEKVNGKTYLEGSRKRMYGRYFATKSAVT